MIPNDRAQRSHHFRVGHLVSGQLHPHSSCSVPGTLRFTHIGSLDLLATAWKTRPFPP